MQPVLSFKKGESRFSWMRKQSKLGPFTVCSIWSFNWYETQTKLNITQWTVLINLRTKHAWLQVRSNRFQQSEEVKLYLLQFPQCHFSKSTEYWSSFNLWKSHSHWFVSFNKPCGRHRLILRTCRLDEHGAEFVHSQPAKISLLVGLFISLPTPFHPPQSNSSALMFSTGSFNLIEMCAGMPNHIIRVS